LEWRYGTPYEIYNIDENTTTTKLAGGFSPLSFATGKKVIEYGILAKCLLKRDLEINGEVVGLGGNLMFDEINRGEFEAFSFMMGFFASPYRFLIVEEGRVMENPNHRPDLEGFRFFFEGTMNIQDVGNNPLSMAFKSRFHFVSVKYDKTMVQNILNLSYQLAKYEVDIFDTIWGNVSSWHSNQDVRFPAGIRHYANFFKFLRNGLSKMNKKLEIGQTGKNLKSYLADIIRSAIVLPIIDENRRGIVDSKEKSTQNIASSIYDLIKTQFDSFNKELDALETIVYY